MTGAFTKSDFMECDFLNSTKILDLAKFLVILILNKIFISLPILLIFLILSLAATFENYVCYIKWKFQTTDI